MFFASIKYPSFANNFFVGVESIFFFGVFFFGLTIAEKQMRRLRWKVIRKCICEIVLFLLR